MVTRKVRPLHYAKQYLMTQEHSAKCVSGMIGLAKGCTCGLSAAILDLGITPEEYNTHARARQMAPFRQPDASWAYRS
jgi:hypothetical protein